MLFKLGMSAAVACFVGLLSSAYAEDGSWDKVIEAAKKEGKVVVYDVAFSLLHGSGQDHFETKISGIPVESLNLRASEHSEHIRTKQAAGPLPGRRENGHDDHDRGATQDGDFVQKLPADPRMPPICNRRSKPMNTAYRPSCRRWASSSTRGLVKEQDVPDELERSG